MHQLGEYFVEGTERFFIQPLNDLVRRHANGTGNTANFLVGFQ